MGQDYQPVSFPLVHGDSHREVDSLGAQPGTLSQLLNGRYDTDGAVSKRFGYGQLPITAYDTLQDFISDGSTDGDATVVNPRRILVAPLSEGGEELLCESDGALWRFSQDNQTWWSVGERQATRSGRHVSLEAHRVAEMPKVRDQSAVQVAATPSHTVVAWSEGSQLFYSVFDVAGRSLLQRSLLSATGVHPVLIAFGSSVGLLYLEGNNIRMRVVTDAAPAAQTTYTLRTNAFNTAGTAPLDAWVNESLTSSACVVYRETGAGDLSAFLVTDGGVVSSATTYATPGDPISVAVARNTGTGEWVLAGAFVSGTNIYTKVVSATLVDAARDVSIAPSTAADIRRISICQSSVTPAGLSGYTTPFYLAWEVNAADDKNCRVDIAVRDSADTVGGTLVETYRHSVLASKIWCESDAGHVFVTVGYASVYQGVALVLRVNDQLSRAVIAAHLHPGSWAGRYPTGTPVPAVPSATRSNRTVRFVATWFATRYKGDGNDYRYRSEFSQAALSILLSDAPRKAVRLRGTTYLSGTPHYQYDGVNVAEGIFEVFPEISATDKTITAAAGSLSAGSYTYQAAYEWTNAAGERMRVMSMPATFTVAANDRVNWTLPTLAHTMAGADVGIVLYRTKVNPTANAPKYRVSGYTPDDANWITNTWAADTVTFQDGASDTSIGDEEIAPSYREIQPSPVAAGYDLLVVADRLYLAGDNDVYPCKPSQPGEVAGPALELVINVPRDGGRITALASEDPNILVMTERQVHGFAGPGLDAFLQGPGWSSVSTIVTNTGALGINAVVKTPQGILLVGNHGPFLLRGNVGIPMRHPLDNFSVNSFAGALLLTGQDSVVIAHGSQAAVWNYRLNRWAIWGTDGDYHCSVNGLHAYVKTEGALTYTVNRQDLNVFQDEEVDYPLQLTWSWIRPGGSVDSWSRIRSFQLLGRFVDNHTLTPSWAYDDEDEESQLTEGAQVSMDAQVGAGNWPSNRYAPEIHLDRRKCASLKVRVDITGPGECVQLTHLSLLIQPKVAKYAANRVNSST